MICANCKNDIPDDSKFCPLCGKEIKVETPKTPPVQEHTEDTFTEDGVIYYSLNPNNSDNINIKERWVHGNDCGGSIYVGSNATCLCGKCRKSSNIRYWRNIKESNDGKILVDISEEERSLQDILNVLPSRADLKWINEITTQLIKNS